MRRNKFGIIGIIGETLKMVGRGVCKRKPFSPGSMLIVSLEKGREIEVEIIKL